nr:hypothetical protein [Tanacetum cinerariifolium]
DDLDHRILKEKMEDLGLRDVFFVSLTIPHEVHLDGHDPSIASGCYITFHDLNETGMSRARTSYYGASVSFLPQISLRNFEVVDLEVPFAHVL